MIICPQCHAQFGGFSMRAGDGDPKAVLTNLVSGVVAGYEAIQTGTTEGVTRRQLFEAAVGTLSIVAQEVPDLQAEKIRGAINALLASMGEA